MRLRVGSHWTSEQVKRPNWDLVLENSFKKQSAARVSGSITNITVMPSIIVIVNIPWRPRHNSPVEERLWHHHHQQWSQKSFQFQSMRDMGSIKHCLLVEKFHCGPTKVCFLKRYIEVPDGALLLWQISVKIFHRDDKIVIFKQKVTKIDIKIAIRDRLC